ncbi:MAG: hypothetical protein WD827_00085 [Solirubrobacterales bacterium]
MAQTKKKRQRKRRGTQGGRIDTSRPAGRPRSREEAKARARAGRKRAPRVDAPPTWRSAITRGLVAAVIFTVLLILIFKRSVGSALGLGGFMLAFYIPAGYYLDTMMWRRRERARIRAAAKK